MTWLVETTVKYILNINLWWNFYENVTIWLMNDDDGDDDDEKGQWRDGEWVTT